MKTLPIRARPALATSANLIEFLHEAIERALYDTERLDPIQTSQLHGLRIQLLTRNGHYAELVKQRVYCGDAVAEACATCRVAVLSPDDSSLPPPPGWGEPIFHPRQFEQLLASTPFRATYFHDRRVWQVYDHQQRFGLLWLTGTHNYCEWEPAAPLRCFLHWFYRFENMRLAHAGSLGKGGAGILLVGKGGSGKSGTVMGGIAHGLESVGDDYLLIDNATDAVRAYPLFRTLKQDLCGLRRLGLETQISQTRLPNWQNKFEFTSEEISGRALAAQLKIRAIVIPKLGASGCSTIRPTTQQRAMLSLAPTGIFQLPGERESGVKFFTDLIWRLPCFELALSSDPNDVARAVETFLDGGLPCD